MAARRLRHTDPDADPSPNPHGHLCVTATGLDGSRLNPRKADLQRWRKAFAERLREHGVEREATPRLERLQSRRVKSKAFATRKSGASASMGSELLRQIRSGLIGRAKPRPEWWKAIGESPRHWQPPNGTRRFDGCGRKTLSQFSGDSRYEHSEPSKFISRL